MKSLGLITLALMLAVLPAFLFGGEIPISQAPVSRVLSEPENVSLTGQWTWGPCCGVAVRDQTVYFITGPTLVVTDISNPAAPSQLGEVLLRKLARAVALQGQLVSQIYQLRPSKKV